MTSNSNPKITSSSATASFSEDANTTGSTVDHVITGTMNFTDSNKTDTHTTTSALKSAVWSGGSTLPIGTLVKFQAGMTSSIIADSNGSGKLKWTFSEDDRDFDFLAKGETLTLTYEITLKDNHGGSTKQTVKITITGTDDKPVFTTAAEATVTEQANKTLSFSLDTANIAVQFTDVDLNNTGHTASVVGVSATGNTDGLLPGSLGTAELMSFFDIENVVKTAGSSTGVVNTEFSAPDLAFDYLAAGEQLVITYVVQVDDKKGGVSNQNVVVTVNGTNDKPVVIGFAESRHLTEGENLSAGNLTASGDFLFSDIDLADTHTVSTTVTATLSGGGTVPISEDDLLAALGAALYEDPNAPGNPDDSTGDLFGKVSWSFALPDSAVNFLAEGEVLTIKYKIIVTDPSGASATEEVTIKIVGTADPALTKTATVNGGTADTVGEVINYTITYSNTGSVALTGVTITDPSVSNLTRIADVAGGNNDNILDVGETWQWTASHTVTQEDLDSNGGGDGNISNTVTADSNESGPVSVTASVDVVQRSSIDVVKTANVSSVSAAGQIITYTFTVTNTGNTSLSNIVVTDPQVNIVTPIVDFNAPVPGAELLAQVLYGDYNVGDLNQNGFQDSGENFVYVNAGDLDQDGVHDPDETFLYTNIGDTNQNGLPDTGETFQYYNAGDTNQNGVEDTGETFQSIVSHEVADLDTNNDTFNDGDVNFDGQLNVGETWQYVAVTYTVTQADIDNGGVFDPPNPGDPLDPDDDHPGLTHNNTASVTTGQGATDDATVQVAVAQNPQVTLTKTGAVADGSADEAGDVIEYEILVANAGNMALTGLTILDPSVSNLTADESGGFNVGDLDQDGKLDLNETWRYTAIHTVTQADIDNGGVVPVGGLTYDNTATVTTDQGATDDDTASVPIVQAPQIALTKEASVPGGTPDAVGDVIGYTISVTNTGNMTLSNIGVSDLSVSDLAGVMDGGFNVGDVDNDGLLDLGETWEYAATHTVTQADLDAGTINNTASVSTDQGATSSDSASVPVAQNVVMTFEKTVLGYHDLNNNNVADAGDIIDFSFLISNEGNVTLHNIGVTDLDGEVDVDGLTILSLAPGGDDGESWTATYTIQQEDVDLGSYENTAVAASDEASTPDTLVVQLSSLILLA